MYTGSIPAASNRATFRQSFQASDKTTGILVDFTGLTITFEIVDRDTHQILITASTTDGSITITGTGVFAVFIAEADMQGLCAGDYDVRARYVGSNGDTISLMIATLPVLEG